MILGALFPFLAVAVPIATADDAELSRLVAEDVARPVRPAGVDGQEFWNGNAIWFMYPPSFGFEPTSGKDVRYRYRILDANGKAHAFEDATPTASLARVWAEIPVGHTEVWCESHQKSSFPTHCLRRQFRVFWKSAPYRPGTYPPAPRSAREAARLGYEYVLSRPFLQKLVETGRNDLGHELNCYPTKMNAAVARAMLSYARIAPERKDAALRLARAAVDYLIARAQPADAPLAHFPPTYEGEERAARSYAGQNMLVYPATAGSAYVSVYEATGEKKYLEAAENVAATYLKLQGRDGTWTLKAYEKDGRPLSENRLTPYSVISFLTALHRVTGKAVYRDAADQAFAFIENGPLRTWNWEGQFEDIEPSAKFINLTKHPPCTTAMLLVKRWPDDPARIAQARELLRFSEDQFVCWERPWRDQRISFQQDEFCPWNVEPAVVEQYFYRDPCDSSAAKLINTYLALYKATGNPLDYAKAKTLVESCIRMQETCGRIPTVWAHPTCTRPESDWINCMISTFEALGNFATVTEKEK